MDKLYSKTALITKAVFCVCLSPLYMLLSSLLSVEDGFLYIILSAVPIGCLYTIPFWLSVRFLKNYRVSGIGKYVLYDAASCLTPAVLGVLCSEIVYTIVNEATFAAGIVTVIFALIFVIVTLLFWLIYLILSRRK